MVQWGRDLSSTFQVHAATPSEQQMHQAQQLITCDLWKRLVPGRSVDGENQADHSTAGP